jgi:hypothetical protein
MRTLSELATELRDLKALLADQEAVAKETKKRIDALCKTAIPELMDSMDIENAKIEGVGTIYLRHDLYANVKADDRDKFYDWLRDNGFDELIKETVHPGTLKAWAKEQLDQAKPLPEAVQAAFVTQASLRKS